MINIVNLERTTDDLTAESDEVVAIANAVFTQEMKDAYTASQASLGE
jgi:hypothetical protein